MLRGAEVLQFIEEALDQVRLEKEPCAEMGLDQRFVSVAYWRTLTYHIEMPDTIDVIGFVRQHDCSV